MTTLHPIGELLRSGVRPTAEETEHLKELGGFVAEMYGRFMGGRLEHLQSAADLWSGKLSSRLSAATGARWEQGLGLAEMLLGSELTSFWQIARNGFASGYDDFAAEMGMVGLYEEDAPTPVEVPVESAPRRRRGSLFGAKGKSHVGPRSAQRGPFGEGRQDLEFLKTAERGADVGSVGTVAGGREGRWSDGSKAEWAVIKALAAGGLFVGDQLAPSAVLSRAGTGSVGVSAGHQGRAKDAASAMRGADAVYLDGLRVDGRTPALASALSRVEAIFGRTPRAVRGGEAAIAQSRLSSLTATAEHSIDRGLGSGERPVYGFYDAVETTYLNLVDDRTESVGASDMANVPRSARLRRAAVMPASGLAQRTQGDRRSPGASSGGSGDARMISGDSGRSGPDSRANAVAVASLGAQDGLAARAVGVPSMSLDAVVPAGRGLRPFVGGVFHSLGSQLHSVPLAASFAHLPSGEAVVRSQRTGVSAPRYSVIESPLMTRILSGAQRAAVDAAAPVGGRSSVFGARLQAGGLAAPVVGSSARAHDAGDTVGLSSSVGSVGPAQMGPAAVGRAESGLGAVGHEWFAADGRGMEGAVGPVHAPSLGAPRAWRLAVDGGADLPLGASFSRHEVFAGGRMAQGAADMRALRPDFRPVVAGEPGPQRSELAEALPGMVWVTLPNQASLTAGGDDLGLVAVPSGRHAAMVPGGLAFKSIAGVVATQGRDAARAMAPSVVGGAARIDVAGDTQFVGPRATPVESSQRAGVVTSYEAPRLSALDGGVVSRATERFALRNARIIDEGALTEALRSGFLGNAVGTRSIGREDVQNQAMTGAYARSVGGVAAVASEGVTAPVIGDVGTPAIEAIAARGGDSVMARWVSAALKSEGPAMGLRAARFLEGAVTGGYGRVDSERALLSMVREASADVAGGSEGSIGDRRPDVLTRRTGKAAVGAEGTTSVVHVRPASVMGASLRAVDSRPVTSDSTQPVDRPSEVRAVALMSDARTALARSVMTARESRAVASLFHEAMATSATSGGATARSSAGDAFANALRVVAQSGFTAAGSDEPVLGRLVQRMNQLRSEQPLAARWQTPSSIVERFAGLDSQERQQVSRAFAASGWSLPELQMLNLESAVVPMVDAALAESAAPRGRGGAQAASPRLDETARASRMGRSLARVLSGSEALGGRVDERSVGLAASSVAQAQAAGWLPLLASQNSDKYFGGLSPVAAAGRAMSMRDVVGDLVKMAEAAVATSDSPVALAARREVLRRLAEHQVSAKLAEATTPSGGRSVSGANSVGLGMPTVVGRETEALPATLAERLGARSNAGVGAERELVAARPEFASVTSVPAFGGGDRERVLRIGDAERTMLGLEREAAAGLEARIAEALALATSGPAGARRMLRSTAAPRSAAEVVEAPRRGGRGREFDEASHVRQTVEHGAPAAHVVRTGEAARRDAALREEMVRGPAIGLGGVMAPEAMLAGLRSPELSQAMRQVSARQAMYGHDIVPVLTTIANDGVDLDAARSSLSAEVQEAHLARRGGLLRAARLADPTAVVGRLGDESAALRGAVGSTVVPADRRDAVAGGIGRFGDSDAAIAALGGSSFAQVMSSLAGSAPEREMLAMVAAAEGLQTFAGAAGLEGLMGLRAAGSFGRGALGRKQKAGLLSAILRGTERAEMTAVLEQAGGRDFAMAWLGRVDGSRSGLDIGMKETRQEFGRTFGGARRDSAMAGDSPIAGASFVQTGAPSGDDRSGLRSLASSVVGSSTGAARPQHGASQAMRRTDWSFVQTGSKAATAHADLGKLAAAIVGSSESSGRAPMPLVAPAAKAVAQTALRDAKTNSANSPAQQGGGGGAQAGSRGPVDAKMSEKAVEMLAIEMANRVARLMGLTNERRGIWS